MTGVLLAVQSMRLLPSREAAQFLLTNNFAAPSVARMAHDSRVVSVAISPDGKYVVSGSWDNTARVWSYRSEDLIVTSCSHVTRNFTINEWRQYLEDMFPYRAICTNLPLPEESLREIAFEALDHTGRPMRVQAAIKIIQDLLSQDKSIDSSEDEAKRIITSVVTIRLEGLSSTSIASDEDLRQAIERIEDAKSLGLDFAEFIYSLDNVCWSGSLYGYAKMY